jgi:hypothetical protein
MATFDDCNLKWWLGKVGGFKLPPHTSALTGREVHTLLERYMLTGAPVDMTTKAGRVANQILPFLPIPPVPPAWVEQEVYVPRQGFGYYGKSDLLTVWVDPMVVVKVYDHKTSSNPKRYGITAEQMPNDPQALVYGAYGLNRFGVSEVSLQWTYGNTSNDGKGNGKPIVGKLTADQIERGLQEKDKTARRMLQMMHIPEAEVPANTSACNKYGGCPYRASICQAHKQQSIAQVIADHYPEEKEIIMPLDEALIAQIRAQALASAGGAAPAQPTAPVVQQPAADPAAARIAELQAQLAAAQAGASQPDAAPILPVATPNAAATVADMQARLQAAMQAAQAQPAAAPVAAVAAPVATPAAADPAARLAALQAQVAAAQAAQGAPQLPAHTLAASVPQQPQAEPVARGLLPTAISKEAVAASKDMKGRIGTLYVNCMPVVGGATDAANLVDAANQLVCQHYTVQHYKLIDYGKGAGALAVALSHVIAALPPGTNVFAYRITDGIEVLKAAANEIVIGMP